MSPFGALLIVVPCTAQVTSEISKAGQPMESVRFIILWSLCFKNLVSDSRAMASSYMLWFSSAAVFCTCDLLVVLNGRSQMPKSMGF
jgi:hypothetical protein